MTSSGAVPARGPLVVRGPTARRSVVPESSSPHCSGRSRTVTPRTPSGVTTGLPGGTCPPSTTSRTCGSAPRSLGPKRGRSTISWGRSGRRSCTDSPTSRTGPTASCSRGLRACGSHLSHSHSARASRETRAATTRSSGACCIAAWRTSERASERAGSASPVTSTCGHARSAAEAGRPGWTRWVERRRCSADAATGSSWASGGVSGGSSSRQSGCDVVPIRTWRKSTSETWRSQTRVPSAAMTGSAAGSG